MELVIGIFVSHKQVDDHTTGYSHSQAEYVDKRIHRRFPEIPKGDLNIIFNHGS
jgi:hypothetical protein